MTAVIEPGLGPRGTRLGQPTTRFSAMVVARHPGTRAGLVHRLTQIGAGDIVEAGSVAEARVRARADVARDLCVAEGNLGDGSGIGLLRELRAIGWRKTVVICPADDPYSVLSALATGVRGFVVASPETAALPPEPRIPSQRLRGLLPGGPEGLSHREIEVIELVAEGMSNRDVGMELGLSALTVKSHLARIARKLGTGDRAEMVAMAMRAGLVR